MVLAQAGCMGDSSVIEHVPPMLDLCVLPHVD